MEAKPNVGAPEKGSGTEKLVQNFLDSLQKEREEVASKIKKALIESYLKLNPSSNLHAHTYSDFNPNSKDKQQGKQYDKVEGILVTAGLDNWDDDGPEPGIVMTKDGPFKFVGGRDYQYGNLTAGQGFMQSISREYWDKRQPFALEDYLKYGISCARAIDEKKKILQEQKA